MKTIFLTLAIWLSAAGVWGNDVTIQIVDMVDTPTMIASGSERTGNVYEDRIMYVDSTCYCNTYEYQVHDSTGWHGVDSTACMLLGRVPVSYGVTIVVGKHDVDGSGVADISDLVAIIEYMFPQENN